MAGANNSPELKDHIERPDNKPKNLKIDENRLTELERRQIKEHKVSIYDLAAEREELLKVAERELDKLATTQEDDAPIISLKEKLELEESFKSEHSPDKIEEKLERLRDLPEKLKGEREKKQEEARELDPDNPHLLALEKQFNTLCDDNKDLLGTKQVPEFKKWFTRERHNHPTIGNLKNHIANFEGKEYPHKEGLAPRREEFKKLSSLFKKYNINDPLESKWIEREGLSERQEFRHNAETLEDHFQKLKDTGFYSREMIQKSMKEILMANSPLEQREILDNAKKIASQEGEGFVHLSEKMVIGGTTILKMSRQSKKLYLDYYKNTDFKERGELAIHWETIVKNEAKLATQLADIYEDDPRGLSLAIKSFGELDFQSKKTALDEHQKLVDSNIKEEEREKILLQKAAETAIMQCDDLSQKTKTKYVEFSNNEDNYKNPNTQKPGDPEILEKLYDILTGKTPNFTARNLAAYKHYRERHQNRIEELEEINPEITDTELEDWQNKYDRESWTNRKKIHEDLLEEIKDREKKQKEKSKLEKQAGIKQDETDTDNETKEEPELRLEETILAVSEYLNNDQGAEAMKLLLKYNEQDPDNPKILFWIKTVAEYMKEFGSGKQKESNFEKAIEKEVESAMENEDTQEEIEEEQLKTLNIRGAKLSEKRHDNSISAQERGKRESMEDVADGSIEEDLMEDFYNEEDGYILDDEGHGEKITELEMGEKGLDTEDFRSIKRSTFENQRRLDDKRGFSHIRIKDKHGKVISSKEANLIHKKKMHDIEDRVTEEAMEQFNNKHMDAPNPPFNLAATIAARRKAKEELEKRTEQKIKSAA